MTDISAFLIHPLEQIVNVHWGDEFRLVSVLVGEFASQTPLYTLRFETPKTFHNYSDIKSFPQYDGDVSIPCVIIPGSTTGGITGPIEITGPTANPPSIRIDHRGYVTITGGPPSTETAYFDYNGKKISKIPPLSQIVQKFGALIASDNSGTVYYKSGNLKKYNKDGGVLWDADISSDTVYFERETSLIRVSFIDPPNGDPFVTVAETQWFNLDGDMVRDVLINDSTASSSVSVSRNSNFFAFLRETDDVFPGIRAWGPEGNELWSIPGETKPGGTLNIGIACYGEDYLIVPTQKTYPQERSPPLSNPFTTSQRKDIGLRILSAKNGGVVFNNVYVSPISVAVSFIFPGGSQVDTSSSTYGDLRITPVSNYWP